MFGLYRQQCYRAVRSHTASMLIGCSRARFSVDETNQTSNLLDTSESKRSGKRRGQLLSILKDENASNQVMAGKRDATKTQTIKSLDSKYSKTKQTPYDLLSILDKKINSELSRTDDQSLVKRAEKTVDSLFFTYVEKGKAQVEQSGAVDQKRAMVTIDTSKEESGLASGLRLSQSGQEDRQLSFEEDSLALAALQEGRVDFADKRVQFKAASLDISSQAETISNKHDMLEVDLGNLKSLQQGDVHIDEASTDQLLKGQQIVDDFTNTDDAKDYRLVMVGRRITADEAESDSYLRDIVQSDSQHSISQDVFHESGEKFSQAIMQNEGILSNLLRHWYLAVALFSSTCIAMKLYQESYKYGMIYEDMLDWVVVDQFKRGRQLYLVARRSYVFDSATASSRTN